MIQALDMAITTERCTWLKVVRTSKTCVRPSFAFEKPLSLASYYYYSSHVTSINILCQNFRERFINERYVFEEIKISRMSCRVYLYFLCPSTVSFQSNNKKPRTLVPATSKRGAFFYAVSNRDSILRHSKRQKEKAKPLKVPFEWDYVWLMPLLIGMRMIHMGIFKYDTLKPNKWYLSQTTLGPLNWEFRSSLSIVGSALWISALLWLHDPL